jgi:hypothetical protein
MPRESGLSFLEWTVLVFLDVAGPLTRSELVRRQLDARIVAGPPCRRRALDRLQASLLVAPPVAEASQATQCVLSGGDVLLARPISAAAAIYTPAGETVARVIMSRVTSKLYGNIPRMDLDATHRTLMEITRRANGRLAVG